MSRDDTTSSLSKPANVPEAETPAATGFESMRHHHRGGPSATDQGKQTMATMFATTARFFVTAGPNGPNVTTTAAISTDEDQS